MTGKPIQCYQYKELLALSDRMRENGAHPSRIKEVDDYIKNYANRINQILGGQTP